MLIFIFKIQLVKVVSQISSLGTYKFFHYFQIVNLFLNIFTFYYKNIFHKHCFPITKNLREILAY